MVLPCNPYSNFDNMKLEIIIKK